MNDHTNTVQNGQSDMAALAVNLGDGIRVDTTAATQIIGAVTESGNHVYALIARGLEAGSDERRQALLLLRVKDAGAIVAGLVRAISAGGDGEPFAMEVGIATERLRHEKQVGVSGMVVNSATLERLRSAAGADGLLDPEEVADVLAGRVPTQGDGS